LRRPGSVWSLILFLALGALIVLPAVPEAGTTSGPDPPRGVHWSYTGDPTEAVATWHTIAASTSRAEWGTSPGAPYPNSVAGTDYSSPGGSFLHTATLTGLTPYTTYYYRLGDVAMASWFDGASFRSAPVKGVPETFTFVAAGKFGNSATSAATASAMGAASPDLAIPLGDLYYTNQQSSVRGVWEKFQPFGEQGFVMTAVGNHDYDEPSLLDHCAFVNQPGNERTYAFTYGNVFFLGVDWGYFVNDTLDGADGTGGSCGGVPGNDPIRAWIDAKLAEANNDPDVWWKIVFHHYPCYLTDFDKNRSLCVDGSGNPDQIEDIYTARGVDIVVSGHAHTYGRTYPVKFNTLIQSGSVYVSPGAPVYTNLGTGGPPRTAACRTNVYIAMCRGPLPTNGYGKFNVSENEIAFEYIENTEGLLDSFVLRKPYDFTVSLDPDRLYMLRSESETSAVAVVGRSTDPVSLSVTGCPASTTCTVSPPSGSPGFSSVLTVNTTAASPYGSWPVTVVATNATQSRQGTLALVISDRVTRTYQRGDGGLFSDVEDTHISDGAPNTNYGGELSVEVDGSGCLGGSTVCKSLIKFPNLIGPAKGQVPPGSQIHSGTLELTITNPGALQRHYRVLESWGEYTATWNTFAVPGMPGNAGVGGTFTPTLGRLLVNITADVQAWADGAVNQGNLIEPTSWDGSSADSSEGPFASRPLLNVTYTPPSTPAPPPPPTEVDTSLGNGLADVVVTWTPSSPETAVDHYEVWRGTTYDPSRISYLPASSALPAGTASWTDVGAGDAASSYFYFVRAVDVGGQTADSPGQAAKLFRAIPAAQDHLLGNPLLTGSYAVVDRVQGTFSWSTVRIYESTDVTDPWKALYSGRGGDAVVVDAPAGVWVDVQAPGDFRATGRVPCVTAVPLSAGWNLVAFPGMVPRVLSAVTAGLIGPLHVEGYDAAAAPYHLQRVDPTGSLAPTEAYWVYSPLAQLWTVVNDPASTCR